MRLLTFALLVASACTAARAHDTWVQLDSAVVPPGEIAHVNLCLGNHGNDHRDFKLASKIATGGWTLDAISPSGRKSDLTAALTDTGLTPREGFWTTRYLAAEPGLHIITHQLDKPHGATRGIKSSKAYLLVSPRTAEIPKSASAATPLGHPIEIVPLFDPILDSTVGRPLRVRILHEGKPLGDARVSFIPRSRKLESGFDPQYERKTDPQGETTWTPEEGDWVLIAVHHMREDQKGEGYSQTQYTATLALPVSQVPR